MYKKSHIHFIGIGGIGMSGLAKILQHQGHIVSGCDLSPYQTHTEEIIKNGCLVSDQHNSSLCHDSTIDSIVFSSAIKQDHPELIHARKNNIKTIMRATMLAEIMRSKYSIGIAGSHGKTTTSSMISHILIEADYDPTIIIGGVLQNIKSNARYGSGKYLVAEADESDRSLLQLPIAIGVLTNIDFEHPDQYTNIGDVEKTFQDYLENLPFYGTAILCSDNQYIKKMMPSIDRKIVTFGINDQADIQAINIENSYEVTKFDIYDHKKNKNIGTFEIFMPGMHNILNATAAIATTLDLNVDISVIQKALASFQGVDRRFTYKGTIKDNKVDVFDDYGHHPTEIEYSIKTAHIKAKNGLVVLFQPQRFSRTKHLWNQFIQAFNNQNIKHLLITDIYGASESPIEGINSQKLVLELQQKNPELKVDYIPYDADFKDIEKKLSTILKKEDLLLLLGAGKVNQLANKLFI